MCQYLKWNVLDKYISLNHWFHPFHHCHHKENNILYGRFQYFQNLFSRSRLYFHHRCVISYFLAYYFDQMKSFIKMEYFAKFSNLFLLLIVITNQFDYYLLIQLFIHFVLPRFDFLFFILFLNLYRFFYLSFTISFSDQLIIIHKMLNLIKFKLFYQVINSQNLEL